MTAHAASFRSPHHTWRNLYLQAVYETDKSKIGMLSWHCFPENTNCSPKYLIPSSAKP
jgi:hypothetical protein